jgi:flagellar basal-body rod protein FlgC
MKVLSIVLFLLFVSASAFACPSVSEKTCESMKVAKLKMELVKSNIANVNTTRTPEGGPYRRQSLKCTGNKCSVEVSQLSPLMKYEPDHPDANEDGYVAYPGINLMEEMADYISFNRDYEFAEKVCVKAQARLAK